MVVRWYLVALLLAPSAAGGCSCGQGDAAVCSSDDQCPTGYLCRASLCTRVDVDAGTSDAEYLDVVIGDRSTGRDSPLPDVSLLDGGSDRSVLDVAIPEGGLDGRTEEAGTSEGGSVDFGVLSDSSPVDVDVAGDSQFVEGGQPAGDTGPLDAAVPETGPIDSGPAPRCGTASLYQDDFTMGVQPYWVLTDANRAVVSATPAGLELTTPATVLSGSVAHAEVRTPYEVDLRGDALTFDMVSATVPFLSGVAHMQLVHDSASSLHFVVIDGVLVAEVVRPSGSAKQQIGAINLFTPGRWRIREEQGTISFETSVANRDGGAWQTHFTTATATHLARGFIQIEHRASDVATISGSVTIRSVNLGQPATTWCRASSWRDDFNGIVALRPEWTNVNEGNNLCILQLNNDQLGIRTPTSHGGECGVVTSSAYSLVDDSVSIEIVSYPPDADLFSRLVVQRPGVLIAYGKQGNNLIAEIYDQGAIVWSSFAATHGNENWLAISDQGGLLAFEFSAQKNTAQFLFAATQTSLHLGEVAIGVTSLCTSACVSGQTLWIDNYN